MNRGVKQGILAVVFLGVLGFIALRGGILEEVWNFFSGARSDAGTALPPEEALRRYGFWAVKRRR